MLISMRVADVVRMAAQSKVPGETLCDLHVDAAEVAAVAALVEPSWPMINVRLSFEQIIQCAVDRDMVGGHLLQAANSGSATQLLNRALRHAGHETRRSTGNVWFALDVVWA